MRKLLVLLPFLLQACSSNPNVVEPTPLASFERSFDVDRLWHRDAGIGVRLGALTLTPAVTSRHLYVADVEGRLYCFDRLTGKRIWRLETGLRIGALNVGYGYLLLGTRDGEAVALKADSGDEVWRVRLSSEVLASPALGADKVVFQTLDGRITALELDTGSSLWAYEESVPVLTLRGTAAPALSAGRVYAAFASGKVVALEETSGLPIWERRIAEPTGRSELDRLVDIDGNLVVENGGVFAVSFQGKLAVLDQDSGRPYWDKDMSSHQRMSSAAGTLFVADEKGVVWCVEQRSGSALWKNEAFLGRGLNGTAVQQGLVLTGDAEGYLHWLDAIDGHQVARRFFDPDGFAAPPVVYDDVLYVLSGDGELAAYRVEPM